MSTSLCARIGKVQQASRTGSEETRETDNTRAESPTPTQTDTPSPPSPCSAMGQGRSRSRGEHGSEMEVVPGNGPPLTTLCEDVLLEIASCCDVKTLGRLRQTCRHLNALLESPLLWTRKANASFSALDKQWRTIARRYGVRSLSACPLSHARCISQRHPHSHRLKTEVECGFLICFVFSSTSWGNQRKLRSTRSHLHHHRPIIVLAARIISILERFFVFVEDSLSQSAFVVCVVSA